MDLIRSLENHLLMSTLIEAQEKNMLLNMKEYPESLCKPNVDRMKAHILNSIKELCMHPTFWTPYFNQNEMICTVDDYYRNILYVAEKKLETLQPKLEKIDEGLYKLNWTEHQSLKEILKNTKGTFLVYGNTRQLQTIQRTMDSMITQVKNLKEESEKILSRAECEIEKERSKLDNYTILHSRC